MESDLNEQTRVIRAMLHIAVNNLYRSDAPNSKVDKVFNVYERVKNELSDKANDELGRAIYGEEWSPI